MIGVSSPLGVFLSTYIAYTVIYSTRKPFSVVKSIFQIELGLDTSTLGLLDVAFLGSYAVGQFVLPSRLQLFGGDKRCLIVSFCGSGVAAIIFSFGSSQFIFFSTFVINGLFHSIVYPTMIKTIVPYFPKSKRGRVLGLWCTSQQIGSLTATALSTALVKQFGWRVTFCVSGLLVFGSGLAIALLLPSEQKEGALIKSVR